MYPHYLHGKNKINKTIPDPYIYIYYIYTFITKTKQSKHNSLAPPVSLIHQGASTIEVGNGIGLAIMMVSNYLDEIISHFPRYKLRDTVCVE